MKRKIIGSITIIIVVSILLIATQQQTHVVKPQPAKEAKFIIASWDYPDEHGQGIYLLHFYENSTGSWLPAPFYVDDLPYYTLHSYDPYDYMNWSVGVAMKIRVETTFNQTLVGVGSTAEGQNYLRHNVTVSEAGQTIFSQQNFTYYDVIEFGEENYYYKYEIILNFLPWSGAIYRAVITHEIYHPIL